MINFKFSESKRLESVKDKWGVPYRWFERHLHIIEILNVELIYEVEEKNGVKFVKVIQNSYKFTLNTCVKRKKF